MSGSVQNNIDASRILYRAMMILPASISVDEAGHIETIFSELLDSQATSYVRLGDQTWFIEALFDFEPSLPAIEALLAQPLAALGLDNIVPDIGPVVQRDWLTENRASFPPLHIGRFWVHGSHIKRAPPAGSLPLLVEAAQAFGSGTHPTTEGCLRAMQMICATTHSAPSHVLDMGCGSAILAMAAQKLWPSSRVIAADNDPVAVRVAAGNARLNKIAPQRMHCTVSNGFEELMVCRSGPYDIILANILAGPLRRMAPSLMPHLGAKGWLILSGILNEQALAVERAYAAQGARCWARLRIGEWTSIVMRRSGVGQMPSLWHGR